MGALGCPFTIKLHTGDLNFVFLIRLIRVLLLYSQACIIFFIEVKFIQLKINHLEVKKNSGISLVIQWLRLRIPNARGLGSIPGQGTKILHAPQ